LKTTRPISTQGRHHQCSGRDPEERKLAQHVLRELGASGMRYYGGLTWEEVS
jgi:hypothetical protein